MKVITKTKRFLLREFEVADVDALFELDSDLQIHRLITKGTLEEQIDSMLKEKMKLANLSVSTDENWIGDLTNSELRELVQIKCFE